jgi:hypothetical protein
MENDTISNLKEVYGINTIDELEAMLAEELSNEINGEIILDIMSPETKGLSKEERWKSIHRNQKIETIIDETQK